LDLIMGKAKNAQKSGASSRRRPNVHNHSDPLIGDTARSGDGVATKLRHTNQRRRRRTNDKLQGNVLPKSRSCDSFLNFLFSVFSIVFC